MPAAVQNLLYFLLFFFVNDDSVWNKAWTSSEDRVIKSGHKFDY